MTEPHPNSGDNGQDDHEASMAEAQPRQDPAGSNLGRNDQEVSARLARRWEPAFETFLPVLPHDLLARILKDADAHFFKESLQALGLAKKWQRSRTNPRALVLIAADVSRVLGDARRSKARDVPASKIVFTWWARRATVFFNGTELGFTLSQIPLPYRLARAIEFLRSLSEGVGASPYAKLLDPLRASQDHLERLFAVLIDAAVAGMSEADISARLAEIITPQPALAGADSSAADEDQPRDAVSEGPRISVNTQGSLTFKPTEAATFHVPSSQTSPGSATALEIARAALTKCRDASAQMKVIADQGDLKGLTEAYEQLKGARHSAEATLENFSCLVRQAGLNPPGIDDATFANEATATAYLNQLEVALTNVDRRTVDRVEAERDELIGAFTSLDLPVPDALYAAASLADVAAVQSQWQPEFVAVRLLRVLSAWPERVPDEFKELPPDRRLGLYERLLETPASEIASEKLLSWVVADATALKASTERGLELLTRAIVNALGYVVPLPPGVWRVYGDLAGPQPADSMTRTGLAAAVANAPEALIDLGSLVQLAALDEAQLPSPLRITLKRRRLLDTPTDEAIPALGELALEAEMDRATLDALVVALIQHDRHSEAVALACLAERANRYACDHEEVLGSLAGVLINAADRDDASRALLRAVLEQADVDWFVDLPDGVVVLLYLIAKTGAVRPWDELRYQSPEVLLAARKDRPALVERWLLGSRLSESTAADRQQRTATASDAADALRDFEHDLKRTSVYTAWSPATEYQKYFNQKLGRAFTVIERGSSYNPEDPDEIVQSAVSQGCAVAEGKAKHRMLEYLTDQMTRLRRIAAARAILGSDAPIKEMLAREAVPLREALVAESRNAGSNSTVQKIYANAIQDS